MVFYVPLGFRGVLFRVGTVLITVVGGVVYWRASRRRAAMLLASVPVPVSVVGAVADAPGVI